MQEACPSATVGRGHGIPCPRGQVRWRVSREWSFRASRHHVTQRGNGRQRTFFEGGDYALYLDLLAAAAERARTQVWAFCLMPNHVHIALTPSDQDGLWRTFGEPHRRYTGYVNARRRTTGSW
jgi:putative transposase